MLRIYQSWPSNLCSGRRVTSGELLSKLIVIWQRRIGSSNRAGGGERLKGPSGLFLLNLILANSNGVEQLGSGQTTVVHFATTILWESVLC